MKEKDGKREFRVGDLVIPNSSISAKSGKKTIFQIIKVSCYHKLVLARIIQHEHAFMIGSYHNLSMDHLDFASVRDKFIGRRSCG